MAKLRYHGDVRETLPKVLGGRFLVQESSYDPDAEVTVVTVVPLVDPLSAAGIR